jgi:copper transport protein
MTAIKQSLMAAAFVAAVSLLATVAAFAHASLISADPRDGAMLATAPKQLTLTFNEPVAPLVFRLAEPNGTIVDLKAVATNQTVTLTPPSGLPQGTHVLSWRVVSADGHPVGGAFVFSVGRPSAAVPEAVRIETGWPVRIAIWIARVVIYCGLFFGIGGVFFATWIGSPPRPATAIIRAVTALAVIGTALSLAFQGLDALAAPLSASIQPAVIAAGYHTSYGTTVVIAEAALLLALVASFTDWTRAARALSFIALLGAAAALASSGHASTAPPQWLMRPAVFLHVAGIAFWAGSLIPLFMLLRTPRGGTTELMRFSAVIPFVLVPLVGAGIVLAVVQLDHVSALWTTGYGLVFLAKCAALVALAALACLNRFVLTPALAAGTATARNRFVRSIGAEIVLVAAIFAIAAFWRFTPPPRALVEGEPAFVHIHTEQAMADVTATPGRAGPVTITVHLQRGDFGPLAAKEVTVRLSSKALGLEPLVRPARDDGNGTWTAAGFVLPRGGIWTVEVEVLIDDFDKVSLDAPIVIAP